MPDPISIISPQPAYAGNTCFMPLGNCHKVVFRPDNYVQGLPSQFSVSFDNTANFAPGDTIIFETTDGNTYAFTFFAAPHTPASAYEVEVGATISASLANVAAALISIPYFSQNYQYVAGAVPTIGAIYPGADYSLTITAYDINAQPITTFAATPINASNLQLLQNYCLNVDIYEIDPNCQEYFVAGQTRPKRVMVSSLCGKPVPDYVICDNQPVPAYQFKVTLDLNSDLEKLFTKQIPPRCNDTLTMYALPNMWKRLYFDYHSCRTDSTGFNNPQSVIGGYEFNVANTHFLPYRDWEGFMPEYCSNERPLTEIPTNTPILTCLDTCNFVTFWSDHIHDAGIIVKLVFSDGSSFGATTLPATGFPVNIGFYGFNFNLSLIYNFANAQFGGTLPPIQTLTGVQVTTGESAQFKHIQYAYDHQLCCQLCTTTLIYVNGLGAFESIAVQCEADEYKWAVETYCNRRDCDIETVNSGSIYTDLNGDAIPNYTAMAGKWVSSKAFEREITIKTLPYIAAGSYAGNSNTYRSSIESYMSAIITKPKDHWLMINGVPHKFVMKSSDYESGAMCWTMKGTISMPYNII